MTDSSSKPSSPRRTQTNTSPLQQKESKLSVDLSVETCHLTYNSNTKHYYETVTMRSLSSNTNTKLTPGSKLWQKEKLNKPPKPPPYKSTMQDSKSSECLTHGPHSKLAPSAPVSHATQTGGKSPLANKEPVQLNCVNPTAGLSLKDLVKYHSKSFPLKVEVVKGDESGSIHAGDVFNVHFVKNTKVVIIVDEDGNKYNLPFNSAAKVGLIYSRTPYEDKQKFTRPSVFETAGDIIYAAERPNVVMATRKIKSQDGETVLIAKNELLMPHEVNASDFGQTQDLRVYSFTNQCEKAIPYKALGIFTTDPFKCKLHLHELLERVPDLFPSRAFVFFTDLKAKNPLPHAIKHKVITIQKESTITTVVASQNLSEQSQKSGRKLLKTVELSIELDIKVALIDTPSTKDWFEDSEEHLYDDTLTLIRGLLKSSPQGGTQSQISSDYVMPQTSPGSELDAQAFLLKQVRSGHEHIGISIEQSELIISMINQEASPIPQIVNSSDNKSGHHKPLDGLQRENENDYQALLAAAEVNTNEYQLLSDAQKITTRYQQNQEQCNDSQIPTSSADSIPSEIQSMVTAGFEFNFGTPPPIPSSPRPQVHMHSVSAHETPPSLFPRTQHHNVKVPLVVSPCNKPTLSPPVVPTSSTPDTSEISSTPVTSMDPPSNAQSTTPTQSMSRSSRHDILKTKSRLDPPTTTLTDRCYSTNEESKSEMEALKTICQKLEQEVQKLQEQMKLVLEKVSI